MKNYYKVLGIPQTASPDEIERAYQVLAKQYNPEKNKGDKYSTERFIDISVAYKTLKDADKRKDYDQVLLSIFEKTVSDTNGISPSGKKSEKSTTGKRRRVLYYIATFPLLAGLFFLVNAYIETDKKKNLPGAEDSISMVVPSDAGNSDTLGNAAIIDSKMPAGVVNQADDSNSVSVKAGPAVRTKEKTPGDAGRKDTPTPDTLIGISPKLERQAIVVGMAKGEVLKIQGTPTSIAKYGEEKQMWNYGQSTVFFVNGRVTSIRNKDNNLKIQ